MNIALLDNGISCKGKLKDKVTEKIEFIYGNMVKENNQCFVPVHGTTCAEIISDLCPEVQYFDLGVLYKDGTTQISILVKALDWCIQNEIKLIHMSLGTVDYFDIRPLELRIKKLIHQRAIIVGAHHNRNIRTYPAAFPGVFGVRQDRYGILGNNQFLFQEQYGIKRENSIVAHWIDKEGKPANSYAAPVVTGYIARFLNKNYDAGFQEVLTYLEKCSIHGKAYPDILENVVRKDESIEIPVIVGIELKKREMKVLKKLFEKRGYQVLLLQEHLTDSSAIPIEYYSGEDISLANILYTVNCIYGPDVIFFDFMTRKLYDELESPEMDIFIFNENNTYEIYAEKLIGTTKELEKIRDIICQYYE